MISALHQGEVNKRRSWHLNEEQLQHHHHKCCDFPQISRCPFHFQTSAHNHWEGRLLGDGCQAGVLSPFFLDACCEFVSRNLVQASEAWEALGGWITEAKPEFGPGQKERFEAASKTEAKVVST